MKKSIYMLLLLISTMPVVAQEKKVLDNIGNDNGNTPEFKFEKEEYQFGTIKQGEIVSYDFKFTNTGSEPLIIADAQGSCGCTVPTFPKEPIMKGQSGIIKVTFNSAGKMGIQDKTVTLNSNAKQNPMVIHITGTVEQPVQDPAVEAPTK